MDAHAVTEPGSCVPEPFLGQAELLVALRVHEHDRIGLCVEVFHLASLDVGALDNLRGGEPHLALSAVEQVAQLGLHEAAFVARRTMLELEHAVRNSFVNDRRSPSQTARLDLRHPA